MQRKPPVIPSTTSSYFSFFSSYLSTPIEAPNSEFKKKHRKRSHFTSNMTASLALPEVIIKYKDKMTSSTLISNPSNSLFSSLFNSLISLVTTSVEPLAETAIEKKITSAKIIDDIHSKMMPSDDDQVILKQIKLLKTHIEEHAARRVDIFFYLLLAVHKKYVIVTKADTVKQHGQGSKRLGTQACHSSLFPNLSFEAAPKSWLWYWSSTPAFSLSGTQLEETLNMTVELPSIVNAFDGHIEGRSHPTRYTLSCLTILNKVANNEMDPKQGMNAFFNVMNDFFLHFEKKYILSNQSKTGDAIKKVWEYEKRGTMSAANSDSLTINDDYLYLMLRLNPKEIASVAYSQQRILPFYKRIQDEILASCPVKKQRLNKMSM